MAHPKYIRSCSIWRALNVIGDKPTLLLLESYWLGARRFSDFQKQTGLLKTVISDRLKKLIEAGCFEKKLYSDQPKRYEYRGTQKFYDLYPVALSMLHWEQNWGSKSGTTKVSLIHTACGETTFPHSICEACNGTIDPRDVSWSEGPGLGVMPATYHRRRRTRTSERDTATPLFEDIVDIIGDRWSTLIIRSIFTNLNSYQDIQNDTAIATNILAERLSELSDKGVIDKQNSVYKLTPKGRDIYPILLALMSWGDIWYSSEKGPPLYLTHIPCGHTLKARLSCSNCGDSVTMRDINFEFSEAKTASNRESTNFVNIIST